ncbi:DinB family protein [Tsukamurella sp. NPDC003166]|uniref:DinB family protein n=1 Tax=Tsukamurella sp. NPDC003166 TaxID=3154444 RepID=UPI00339FDA91
MTETQNISAERTDILDLLAGRRHFLRFTAQNLTDEQATTRSTVSELTIGGLIKHVTAVEKGWQQFAKGEGHVMADIDWENPADGQIEAFQNGFRLVDGETLEWALAEYERTGAITDEMVRTADLDASYELPEAPWQPPGVFWSVRRVFLHIAAETAQHTGHADIIREAIDGQKSMG